MNPTSEAPPVLFLSHGAPPLADDARWTTELSHWGARLPRPNAVLVVSAHWEEAPTSVSATRNPVGVVHDFWGFPAHYYDVEYPAPQAPGLADRVDALVGGVHRDESRGLDHGAYVPLVEMFPAADVPTLQLSLPTLAPADLLAFGRALAPLRDEGVLVVGSGFTTHNLRWFDPQADSAARPPSESSEFDDWARAALAADDVDALLDARHAAPAFDTAHPRSEHWAPLYVAMGAALGADGTSLQARTTVDGFWYGLSKRSWQFG